MTNPEQDSASAPAAIDVLHAAFAAVYALYRLIEKERSSALKVQQETQDAIMKRLDQVEQRLRLGKKPKVVVCFTCKKVGHKAASCPSLLEQKAEVDRLE